jgi:histidinol-phosphate aminotransferase
VPVFSSIVNNLPFMVPFMAPEALERLLGRPMELRLGANESNFGVSPLAKEAMTKALERIGWYCDPECFELREELAAVHGVTRENVLVGSGLDDVLSLCARTFLDPGDHAVNSLGGYPTFNYGVQGAGGALDLVPYKNDRVDLLGLVEVAKTVGAKLLFVANPDNPSGTWHSPSAIAELVENLPPECILLLDEAYVDFAPTSSLPPIDVADDRVIRLRTFSKAHGLAGARVGYAIASAEIVASFNKIRMHFGVNLVAQAGALASLRDPAFLAAVVKEVERGREDYKALATLHDLKTLPSATNFVAIDMGSFERAKATLDAMLKRGVFIRMPGAEPLNRCIRVTVGTESERSRFAEEFAAVI